MENTRFSSWGGTNILVDLLILFSRLDRVFYIRFRNSLWQAGETLNWVEKRYCIPKASANLPKLFWFLNGEIPDTIKILKSHYDVMFSCSSLLESFNISVQSQFKKKLYDFNYLLIISPSLIQTNALKQQVLPLKFLQCIRN